MSDKDTVARFARFAALRMESLLRLRQTVHVYEPTAGMLDSKVVVETGQQVTLDRMKSISQPYSDLRRFVSDERVMQYIVDPGLLPLATSMTKDITGKKLLVTRRVGLRAGDRGAIAHVPGVGIRIRMYLDQDAEETILVWDCLYGVA